MIWNFKTGNPFVPLQGHNSYVFNVAITLDNKYVVSGGHDKTIKIWDMKNYSCIKTLKGHEDSVYSVVITHDANYIISASKDNTIRAWNISTGECLYVIHNDCEVAINEKGYFRASDDAIENYIRIRSNGILRRLLASEMKYFRQESNFLNLGKIIPNPKVEPIIIDNITNFDSVLIDIDDEIPF